MENVQSKGCSVNGCERRAHCKGLCQQHYGRLRRTGGTGDATIKKRSPRGQKQACKIDRDTLEDAQHCW